MPCGDWVVARVRILPCVDIDYARSHNIASRTLLSWVTTNLSAGAPNAVLTVTRPLVVGVHNPVVAVPRTEPPPPPKVSFGRRSSEKRRNRAGRTSWSEHLLLYNLLLCIFCAQDSDFLPR